MLLDSIPQIDLVHPLHTIGTGDGPCQLSYADIRQPVHNSSGTGEVGCSSSLYKYVCHSGLLALYFAITSGFQRGNISSKVLYLGLDGELSTRGFRSIIGKSFVGVGFSGPLMALLGCFSIVLVSLDLFSCLRASQGLQGCPVSHLVCASVLAGSSSS